MMKNYPGADLMRSLLTPAAKPGKVVLDSATPEGGAIGAADYVIADLRMKVVAALAQWAETPADELAEGESMADRLLALVVGIIDADKDGEITEEEQAVADMLLNAAWEYLASKGVSEADCDALLNEWDVDAANRVKDLLAEGGDATDLDDFAFDEDAESPVFDSTGAVVMDAVYKKRMVVRGGRKMRVNKRISGVVRLSAKQKIAVRKMHRKSHSAAAMLHRMKSMRLRKASGL